MLHSLGIFVNVSSLLVPCTRTIRITHRQGSFLSSHHLQILLYKWQANARLNSRSSPRSERNITDHLWHDLPYHGTSIVSSKLERNPLNERLSTPGQALSPLQALDLLHAARTRLRQLTAHPFWSNVSKVTFGGGTFFGMRGLRKRRCRLTALKAAKQGWPCSWAGSCCFTTRRVCSCWWFLFWAERQDMTGEILEWYGYVRYDMTREMSRSCIGIGKCEDRCRA